MDFLFLGFVAFLVVAGLSFLSVFIYRLDRTPEMTPRVRNFNRGMIAGASLILLVGVGTAYFAASPLADWGLVVGLAAFALMLVGLAAQGFGVGFQQMDEDGIGFLRFFQLGSAIVFCMAFVPAFIAFIVYASRLK